MTDFNRVHQSHEIVLLILSGDRSSFLSACYLIEQGYNVYMVTYDNGCIPGIDNIKEVADRIIKKYGSSKALFLGVQSVTAYLFRFQEPFLYNTTGEFSKKYPNLHPAQLPCLACHMGMFVRAIAYCKVHNISYIAAGIRNLDNAFLCLIWLDDVKILPKRTVFILFCQYTILQIIGTSNLN